jgi:hypothetical protein
MAGNLKLHLFTTEENYATYLFSFARNSNIFFTLSSSHHNKYTKRHMFGVLNIGKK